MTPGRKLTMAAVLLGMLVMTGCGKKVEVTITDEEVDTTIETKVPNTVKKILEEAEIVLNEEDETEPALDEKLEDAGRIIIHRMHHVSISVDGKKTEAKMLDGTVADILKQENITLEKNMIMNVKNEDRLTEGMEIVIESSYGVTVVHDGKEESLGARKGTVADFLKAANITLGADDMIDPAVDTEITEGLKIVIQRVVYEEVTETVVIPFNTVRQNDSTMNAGTTSTVVNGVNGEKNVTYRIKKVDGVEAEREVLKEEVVKNAVDAVVKVGTKQARYVVSRIAYPNCDDGSHGYYEIHYSDGTVEYEEY
ncbi:MAG: DUF348 domain-containing protein [Solobacterium sp.]|nr:DUF348 domain-containing protein [Solobacterium sp.]